MQVKINDKIKHFILVSDGAESDKFKLRRMQPPWLHCLAGVHTFQTMVKMLRLFVFCLKFNTKMILCIFVGMLWKPWARQGGESAQTVQRAGPASHLPHLRGAELPALVQTDPAGVQGTAAQALLPHPRKHLRPPKLTIYYIGTVSFQSLQSHHFYGESLVELSFTNKLPILGRYKRRPILMWSYSALYCCGLNYFCE